MKIGFFPTAGGLHFPRIRLYYSSYGVSRIAAEQKERVRLRFLELDLRFRMFHFINRLSGIVAGYFSRRQFYEPGGYIEIWKIAWPLIILSASNTVITAIHTGPWARRTPMVTASAAVSTSPAANTPRLLPKYRNIYPLPPRMFCLNYTPRCGKRKAEKNRTFPLKLTKYNELTKKIKHYWYR